MTELQINLADAEICNATPQLIEILNMLGQDKERGYRTVLAPLLTKARLFDSETNKAEKAIQVLNFVVDVCNIHPFKVDLTDDKLCDLCSFFIQRIKHIN